MPHGPYWDDLPTDGGKKYVGNTAWDLLLDNVITWQALRNANTFGISSLGPVTFHSGGYIADLLKVSKLQAGIGPIFNIDNPDTNIGSGGEIRHTAGTVRGALRLLVGEAPDFGTEYDFTSAGSRTMRIRSRGLGVDISSPLGAGTGISPVLNLENSATSVNDGVEIQHKAGTVRGSIKMVIGASPFGTDFIFTSNGVVRFRVNSNGRVAFIGLPTSPAGLSSGEVWLNSGVMTVV